ncbi:MULTISPECIES: hypothetical protein [Providencia]|uniref:hypothetical protein n=1 Tax=Providencia TaxID=586 RepID=UPI001C5BA454|nr:MULTISPECIES: hypothetical protein [Providencia]ELR5152986.1 hypothetical protein [Providencia rettgeri]QXX84040.1 hypothetical protein J6836_06590 [Providencia sp. R33]
MSDMQKWFVKLQFENGKDITISQFESEYEKGNYFIYIELTKDNFSPNIYLPNASTLDPISGSIIHVINESSDSSKVHTLIETSSSEFILPAGMTLIALGNPNLGWSITGHFY